MPGAFSTIVERSDARRMLLYMLWPAGLALGVVATWVGEPELLALDGVTGFALLGVGLIAWSRRPQSAAGPIMAAAGFAWFFGSLFGLAVYLHRGPLAHLLLSYPGRRLVPPSSLERAAVVVAYAYAGIYPIARNDYATIAFALGLIALMARRYVLGGGLERGSRLSALVLGTAFALVVFLGAAARLAGVDADRAMLWAYEVAVCLVAVGLFVDLLRARRAQATVTGLVVDLGEPGAGLLRDRLARTLGDPTLVVGYWLPDQNRYVDEAGRPVELPAAEEKRALTPIEEDGRRVAVLVHDPALLEDPGLLSPVASATRLAVSNARLQAEVLERVAQVEASRRRIVVAADEERGRLERALRSGTQQRLARVAELVVDLDPELDRQLEAAQTELDAFALGVQPRTLTKDGLAAALRELAERSSVPVVVAAPDRRFPSAVEAAAYFTCSEALANVAKHARASHASIRVAAEDGLLTVEILDDGIGGAEPSVGSGLHGLADRMEALGGQLVVESLRGAGTRIVARLPV